MEIDFVILNIGNDSYKFQKKYGVKPNSIIIQKDLINALKQHFEANSEITNTDKDMLMGYNITIVDYISNSKGYVLLYNNPEKG